PMKPPLSTRKPLFMIALIAASTCLGGEWQSLFNGKDMSGWTVMGQASKPGTADFQVENGMIVGTSKLNVPNTFLCTQQTYGDFILEFEVMVDHGLNSGVQFRSLSDSDHARGRVHGYQVEIDTSARAWSGGLFDEGRRGWLYPLSRNEKGQAAFVNGKWNRYRIEAVGSSIRTWVNGIQCARLVDDMTAEGFIALQVHSISRADQAGLAVRWKNIRILTEPVEEQLMAPDPDVPEVSWLKNQLTEYEKRHGWRLLWDGRTTDGWRRANGTSFPAAGWNIEDGILTVAESGGGESRVYGDIVTVEEFSSFELEVDFMITAGANSGIKYFVVEGLNKGSGSAIGLEYQILDDELHPDAKEGVEGNRTLGSLYDLIRADNLSEPGNTKKRFNGPEKWNKARIVVRGSHVEHWLNNVKVVEYERGSQIYRNLVAKSKYGVWEKFGEAPSGHLLLQDHGNRVSFRSIKVREL
ncbi:MAG TPA: DUF1080 domain-containing protein, partial [Oceanipulchritudo sp.]|nr:DUF1080 domain-containing protein [Oceanipulchritudo sp.]